MNHLEEWSTQDNKDFNQMKLYYSEILTQFKRYIGHSLNYLGGIYLYAPVKGENKDAYTFVPKSEQKEALKFMFRELRDMPNWLANKNIIKKFQPENSMIADYQGSKIRGLFSSKIFSHLGWAEKEEGNKAYTQLQYMNDVYNHVWVNTKRRRNLNYYERNIQYNYVKALLSEAGHITAKKKSRRFRNENEDLFTFDMVQFNENTLVSADKESDVKINMRPILFHMLKKTKTLLKQVMNTGNEATKLHYQNLYHQIEKSLSK